jgi:hypothetical protein
MHLRLVRSATPVALTALLVAGCGSGASTPTRTVDPTPTAGRRTLDVATLDRELSNSFRRGLYRLAVVTQPGDDAADLGQPLPTALLDHSRCAPVSGAGRWRCDVAWETVSGRARTTGYAVRTTPEGCWYGVADPAYGDVYDHTIRTYSEHPLNTISPAVRGC